MLLNYTDYFTQSTLDAVNNFCKLFSELDKGYDEWNWKESKVAWWYQNNLEDNFLVADSAAEAREVMFANVYMMVSYLGGKALNTHLSVEFNKDSNSLFLQDELSGAQYLSAEDFQTVADAQNSKLASVVLECFAKATFSLFNEVVELSDAYELDMDDDRVAFAGY